MRTRWFVSVALAALAALAGCEGSGSVPTERTEGVVSYLNPEGLHRNPSFSQVVTTAGPTRTVYVGGQNSVDASGTIVGKGDIAVQAAQVARNLRVALASAGASPEHVIKWTICVVHNQPVGPAMGAFQEVFGELPNPPAISVLFVSALAHPDFLLEIEAIAVVPET